MSSPVRPELIHCCASGKSVNGTATHRNESATSRARSSRATGMRAAGTSQSTPAPNSTRSQVIRPGSNASSPIAMNRNDDPQISPIEMKSAQSSAVNAPRCVPTLVDNTPLVTGVPLAPIVPSPARAERRVPDHSRVIEPGGGSG